MYELRTTVEELRATGSPDIVIENYGKFRWVLDGGHFEVTQKNGASDRWAKGTYVVRDDIVELTVEEFGAAALRTTTTDDGRGVRLHLEPLPRPAHARRGEGAISPEPFLAKPWTRVD